MQLSEIAQILGSVDCQISGEATGYSIDSRSLEWGDLFFAIRGPRFDGHQYIEEALEKGAAGAVVREDFPGRPGWPVIHVSEPEAALQKLASAVRRRWGGPVIGVTGSSGKTTTKEMIAAVLGQRLKVLKSANNLNNHFGVPLTLLRLAAKHQAAVVEMAMSGPGEIKLLASIAGPQTGVVTNVGAAHLAFFDSLDSIARAKRELIEGLQPPEAAVLNHDDARVIRFREGFRGKVVTYGFSEGSDFRCLQVRSSLLADGQPLTEFEVEGPELAGWFSIPLPGRHNVENALAALAAGSLFGIQEEEARAGLSALRLPGQRARVLHLAGEVTVIDDAYNSNPRAMERMIETLASWPGAARRIVLAGEMLELGAASPELHRRVGRECALAGVDWLIAVQGDASYFIEGARSARLPADRANFFPAAREAGRFCRGLMKPGDVILVKGSRGVKLEQAVAELQEAGG